MKHNGKSTKIKIYIDFMHDNFPFAASLQEVFWFGITPILLLLGKYMRNRISFKEWWFRMVERNWLCPKEIAKFNGIKQNISTQTMAHYSWPFESLYQLFNNQFFWDLWYLNGCEIVSNKGFWIFKSMLNQYQLSLLSIFNQYHFLICLFFVWWLIIFPSI